MDGTMIIKGAGCYSGIGKSTGTADTAAAESSAIV